MSAHDSVGDGKAQAGAALAACEESLPHARQLVLRDPGPVSLTSSTTLSPARIASARPASWRELPSPGPS